MPEVLGRLRPPRIGSAPATPALGELYYDTGANTLYWWNGTAWVSAGSSGGAPPTPSGVIVAYAGASAPTGWLLCDGSAVSRTTYAALYAALGGAASPYGQGDGSTTFNVPDLRGRSPFGKPVATTFPAGSPATLGATGGEDAHTLTTTEMPSHTHTGTTNSETTDHTHAVNFATAAGGSIAYAAPGGATQAGATATQGRSSAHTHAFTSNPTGSGALHNNLPPYLVANYLIKT